jgi:guanylate kinase
MTLKIKVKKEWKKLIFTTITAFVLNQLSPYATGCLFSLMKSKIDTSKVNYPKVPNNFTALDYLNLSRAITHEKVKGKINCKDYSFATYDIYRNLLKNNNKNEFRKYVRLVIGEVQGPDQEVGNHVWLEIKLEDGKFHQYETTLNDSYSTLTKDIKKYEKENIDFFNVIKRYSVTLPGTKFPLPTKEIFNLSRNNFLNAFKFYKKKLREFIAK